jgi:hypothetical protein
MAKLMTLEEVFDMRERMAQRDFFSGVRTNGWMKDVPFEHLARFVREMANLEKRRAERDGREFTPIYWYRQPGQPPIMTLWDMNDDR